MELQRLLTQQGDDIGDIDGKVGLQDACRCQESAAESRTARGFLPEHELIERLRARASRR